MESYIPPHSKEAEANVLASCMLDNDIIPEVISKLNEDDFFIPKHKMIFTAINELYHEKEAVDLVSVSSHNTDIEFVYLAEMAVSTFTTSSTLHHCDIVYQKSMLRQMIKTTTNITRMCYEQRVDIADIVGTAEREILAVNRIVSDEVSNINDSVFSALEQLEKRFENGGGINGLGTGFPSLDAKLGGLQKGELYIVAARPSMGKTSLAENIATHASIKKGMPTMFFSMEMKKERIIDRMIASYGLIDSNKIKLGALSEDDWRKVSETTGQINNGKLYIDDTPNIKAAQIKAKCRRIKAKEGLSLVVVDHLTEMWRQMSGKDVQEHEANVREMKRLAGEMDCPVILLQQLNRQVEHRADKRPVLSDLKETGASEEVADVVMMLYRDDYYNENTERKNIAEIIITKGRNIGTGTIEMVWLPQYTKFAEMARCTPSPFNNQKREWA